MSSESGDIITMAHGAGGRLSQRLVEEHFLPRLANAALRELGDSAIVGELALTTDSYTVDPRFFPGGDIGRLAICGTVNDLAMAGAEPIGLTAGFVLEEGLPLEDLDRIVGSMAAASQQAGVEVVAGDTKVVARGACDGVFINTAGVGRVDSVFRPAARRAEPDDAVLVSGPLGDHGMAVMAEREGLPLRVELLSDVAPLIAPVRKLKEKGIDVHALRDPTRGGAAQSLTEIAGASGVRIVLDEASIPVRPEVRSACELLGIDPLHVANEGRLIAIVPGEAADEALRVLRSDRLCEGARAIGRVERGEPSLLMETELGATRAIRLPLGELLPRIC